MIDDPDLPPLDDDLASLLRTHADQAEQADPSLEAMQRVRARVDATIGALPPPGSTSPTPANPDPTSGTGAAAALPAAATATTGSLALVALVAFGLGAGAGVLGARLATTPDVRIEERRIEVPVRVVERVYIVGDAGLVASADAGVASLAAGPSDVTTDTGTASARDAGVATTGRDHDLAGENALVSRAQSALARGRTGEALEALAEHQRRFPSGEFVEEREALTIQALARAGRMDAARARATRFRTRYPRSMLLRAIDAVVGPEETP